MSLKKNESARRKKGHSEDLIKRSSFYRISILLSIGFGLVLYRLVTIQWVEHQQWVQRANRAHETSVDIASVRGSIFDRAGHVLATNVDLPSLYAIPDAIRNKRAFSRRIAPVLGISEEKILERLQQGGQFVWLQRKIAHEKREAIKKKRLEGIGFVLESKRVYPKASLFGHLLGFAGIDNQGLEGIELKYDATLSGEKGRLVLERDGLGKSIFPENFNYIQPAPGKDLHLTVDEVIQYVSERELDRVVKATGAKGGTVVALDPWSGDILSMAVQPKFNPNDNRPLKPSQSQWKWRNRTISDYYEPGSTFKIVTAAAAIEEGLIEPEELIDCEEGAYPVRGTVIHDHDPMGVIPFSEVMAHSSNIGMVKVAEILGPDRLLKYARSFGFGERLGVDLLGESPGLLRKKSAWSRRSLASIAIGQEIGATPLQVVTAASVIANGGWLMTPRILKTARNTEGDWGNEPQIRRRVLSEKTAKTMVNILEKVISPVGTAQLAAVPGYRVAGKTGTAQKINPETGRYDKEKFVSSFVGFVPAEDPAVVILVMVDEPRGVAYGGTVAAPVFSSIAKEVLYHLRIPPRIQPQREPLTNPSVRQFAFDFKENDSKNNVKEDIVKMINRKGQNQQAVQRTGLF